MRLFADGFVVAMNSGIPWLKGWSNFLWENLREGKPCADPSSDFLLYLQRRKEKHISYAVADDRMSTPLFPLDPMDRNRSDPWKAYVTGRTPPYWVHYIM